MPTAKNPPPVCAGIPFLEKEASICLALYDLEVQNSSVHGCLKLEVRLYHVLLKDLDLGCFNMPLEKIANVGVQVPPEKNETLVWKK